MTREEREKAINKIMGYLATYLSVEQYAEAERIIKELRQDTVSRESYNLAVDCIDRAQAQTEIELNASRYTLAKERGSMGKIEWGGLLIKVGEAVDIIRSLPSVTPTTKWIPVSERLPEQKGEYLVTYHPCYWGQVREDIKVGLDSFRGKTTWAKNKYQKVIAWKPLPKPFKEEKE